MRIISTDRQSYFDKFRLSTESLSVFYAVSYTHLTLPTT